MPCVQKKAQQEHQAYIRANRRDVDPYEGLEDPVEILKVYHSPWKWDPLIRYTQYSRPVDLVYAGLDPGQIAALIRHAHGLLKKGSPSEAGLIARCLVAFTSADISSLLGELVRRAELRPEFVFHRATPEIRDLLIQRLDRAAGRDSLLVDKLLCALAWVGDERVVELFGSWRIKRPSWESDLHIPAEKYSQQAGWEVSSDFQRRNLYHHTCYPLVRASSPVGSSPVGVLTDRPDRCPSCSQPLTNLFELAGTSQMLEFLGCPEPRIFVPSCGNCVIDFLGKVSRTDAQWLMQYEPALRSPSVDSLLQSPRALAPAESPRSPWHAAESSLPTTYSQIGGHPAWIQDGAYPTCPDCSRTMVCIGQIAGNELYESAEGIFYAFLCAECRTTASSYQQT